MTTSERGINLVKESEGLRLTAYKDAVGVLTIGYGHTGDVEPGQVVDEQAAEALLKTDLTWAEQSVLRLVTVPINQSEFDALVSFTFNLGSGSLRTSTLLKRLNGGERLEAAKEFPAWCYGRVNGEKRILPGLLKRRLREALLFLSA